MSDIRVGQLVEIASDKWPKPAFQGSRGTVVGLWSNGYGDEGVNVILEDVETWGCPLCFYEDDLKILAEPDEEYTRSDPT